MARPIVTFIIVVLLVQLGLFSVSHVVAVESRHDLLFEANTLLLVLYLAFVSLNTIRTNRPIRLGIALLIANSLYEVVTEFDYFNAIAASFPMTDSLIEDGLLQLSLIMLAIGITRLVRQMNENATIDELTGLYNRKKLNDIELDVFDLVFIDLDGLKLINDTKGHLAGDLVIARFANVLLGATHPHELAFRVGGDEFVVLCRPNRGQTFVDQVQMQLDEQPISFSYGIEASDRESLEESIERTDKAMYEMKNAQRKDR